MGTTGGDSIPKTFAAAKEAALHFLDVLHDCASEDLSAPAKCTRCRSICALGHFAAGQGKNTKIHCFQCGPIPESTWKLLRLVDGTEVNTLRQKLSSIQQSPCPLLEWDDNEGLKCKHLLSSFLPDFLQVNGDIPHLEVQEIVQFLDNIGETTRKALLDTKDKQLANSSEGYVKACVPEKWRNGTRKRYFSTNMVDNTKIQESPIYKAMRQVKLWKACHWWPDSNISNQSWFLATLVVLGCIGTSTQMHVDRSEAWNLAMAIIGRTKNIEDTLAVWLMVSPVVLEFWLHDFLQNSFSNKAAFPNGVMTAPFPHFTYEQMKEINTAYQEYVETGQFLDGKAPDKDGIKLMEQKHGQAIYVPPGWAHAVYNLQPCLKVARDVYNSFHFPLYACVAGGFTSNLLSDDYMNAAGVARGYLRT
jgi:hypothetical protein